MCCKLKPAMPPCVATASSNTHGAYVGEGLPWISKLCFYNFQLFFLAILFSSPIILKIIIP